MKFAPKGLSLKTTEVHFVLSILFDLTLAFDKVVLYGNIAFPIVGLWTQKHYSSFLKKCFCFSEI